MYFLKRNWKNIIVFCLCVIGVILWVFSIRAGSVDEVRRVSKNVAGVSAEPVSFASATVSSSPGDGAVISGAPDESKDPKKDDKVSEKKKEDNTEKKQTPSERKTSDGTDKNKDKYDTDPVPKGKPEPVNKEDQTKTKDWFYVYLSIDCETVLDHMDSLSNGLEKYVGDGIILKKTKVKCYKGESVWDVLLRECKARGINLESKDTPGYGSAYVEAINNLGEFDCGELSGWCYSVDDWFPNYGCSRYILKEGEQIRWRYTCDLGRDVGASWD